MAEQQFISKIKYSNIDYFIKASKIANSLTIQLNGDETKVTFDGSEAKTINITASSIGAASSSLVNTVTTLTDSLTEIKKIVDTTNSRIVLKRATGNKVDYIDGNSGLDDTNASCTYTLPGQSGQLAVRADIPDIPTSLPASDVYAWAKAATKPTYQWSEITNKPTSFTPAAHTHNDYITSEHLGQNYYTKTHIDDNFAKASHNHDSKYAPISHNHDDRYYTETEIDTKIKGTSNAIPKFTSANSIGDSVITQDNYNNITVSGKMIVKSSGSTSSNSYNEGIRILPASNGWSELFFSNDQSTVGTHANGWILGKRGASGSTSGNAGDFTIETNGSTGTGLTLYANGNKPRWNNNELAYKSEIPTSLPASDVYAWAKASSKPTYNFSEINSRGEAYLEWGGQNINNSWSPIDAAMVPSLGANRMAFALARGITVEYSRDGGATWTDYGLSDSEKTALFSGPMARAYIIIGKPTYNSSTKKYENVGINNRARITIDTNSSTGSYIYTILNKFVVDISSSGSVGCKVIIEGQTKANSDAGNNTWENFANTDISGWSGYNIINTSGITTYGNSSWQYTKLRFTFYCTTNSGMEQYGGLTIMNIYGFGGYGWNTPSYMAKWGSIYHYDAAQNASFPAGVSATSFTENGTSLANKYAPKSHTHKAAASGSTATTINTYSMNYSNGVLTITSGTTNVASTSHTHDVS